MYDPTEIAWECLRGLSYEQIFFSMLKVFGSTMPSAIFFSFVLGSKPVRQGISSEANVYENGGGLVKASEAKKRCFVEFV